MIDDRCEVCGRSIIVPNPDTEEIPYACASCEADWDREWAAGHIVEATG